MKTTHIRIDQNDNGLYQAKFLHAGGDQYGSFQDTFSVIEESNATPEYESYEQVRRLAEVIVSSSERMKGIDMIALACGKKFTF